MKKVKTTKRFLDKVISKEIIVYPSQEVRDFFKDKDPSNPTDVVCMIKNYKGVVIEHNKVYSFISTRLYKEGPVAEPPIPPQVIPIKQKEALLNVTKAIKETQKAKTIWDEGPLFKLVFPELADVFDTYAVNINKSNCTGCTATSRKKDLVKQAAKVYKERADKDKVIPDELLAVMSPQFSTYLAQVITDNKAPSGSLVGNNKILVPKIHAHQSTGHRLSCLDCVCKHLAQAMILFQEAEAIEYKVHHWLAIGHMAEAESESLSSYPELAEEIRSIRLAIMEDRNYKPNIVDVIEQVEALR